MTGSRKGKHNPWQTYYGPNLGYVQEQYERYVNDNTSVDREFQVLFEQWGAPPSRMNHVQEGGYTQPSRDEGQANLRWMQKVVDASKLVWNIRTYGHLAADIDPLGLSAASDTRLLEPESFQLSKEDLMAIPAEIIWENAHQDVANGWDAIEKLKAIYTKSIAYEFSHVHEQTEREWLNEQVEAVRLAQDSLTDEEKTSLLTRLVQAEQFEHFLHRTFTGQKRFSIEGMEVLIPMLDEMVKLFSSDGAEYILMGMAHRGRLNVLAHLLRKPYSKIFSEFHHAPNKDMIPSEGSRGINFGWTGDVKYHLGAKHAIKAGEVVKTRLRLANNPSHLEFVNPVVEGFTRAAQEDRSTSGYPVQNVSLAATILLHGDAAFPGEGVVAETLNFNKLPGYRNGGTVHFIVNNRLGFTTESEDARSTHYASDLAKGFEIPIVHVNADDPEACLTAVRLAAQYRSRFKKDFLIDLIGYRRYGHNEMDDPGTTQPIIYNKVNNHPSVTTLYSQCLIDEGLVTDEQMAEIKQEFVSRMEAANEKVKHNHLEDADHTDRLKPLVLQSPKLDTAVPLERLSAINEELLRWPDGFEIYPKLKRILQRRAGALDEGGQVDWALAETLAFATILEDGKPIRISGQDSERGTFAHRHLILHNAKSGENYCPLHQLPQAKASFAIHNSPLSEASVLGFEYGYNVYAPETLVIWEAQYGDFTNAGQVIIDQFISAGREKWSQISSLVMLLPHGYEGQGPEHSSARLERFLQAAAEDNWIIANLTSAAQYFHILRRQAAMLATDHARPLIIMSPKSLIRNPKVASPREAFSKGAFMEVVEQPGLAEKPEQVNRILLCSGKVAVDLEAMITNEQSAEADWSWLHIVRIEQLYPFPEQKVAEIIQRLPNVKELVWVQEEPENMGAWRYIEPRLRAIAPEHTEVAYIGRPERSSTASGYQNIHSFEQEHVLTLALTPMQSQ
ncbi:2-oxoglutarate dehydrogenase E1 component [Paenibacillus abyssi]|uniref:2-oxoglutarate dehydrogenase E1 component n=1 Tax=Paenibacillus abyssi TaxID=1340531 RepID=A0A917FZ71_9BACL|nr:2-oxoglutarate dehydrogenase E1 component [Paenibacillus abyssi]GGG14938.1 2-oxoglutarate dehydrogenase E1 component [Paenibacillus abyssi]